MELTLNCSPACAWISASSRRHSSPSSLPQLLEELDGRCGRPRLPSRASTRHERAARCARRGRRARGPRAPRRARRRAGRAPRPRRPVSSTLASPSKSSVPSTWSGDVQLEREVAQREVFEEVLPLARDRAGTPSPRCRGRAIAASRAEPVHQLLGAVRDERRARRDRRARRARRAPSASARRSPSM